MDFQSIALPTELPDRLVNPPAENPAVASLNFYLKRVVINQLVYLNPKTASSGEKTSPRCENSVPHPMKRLLGPYHRTKIGTVSGTVPRVLLELNNPKAPHWQYIRWQYIR